jgi:hypothetical protein
MLRVAAWTGGLFAVGAGVVQLFPGAWVEPVVLAVLGGALILASGRRAAATGGSGRAQSESGLEPAERAAQ